MTVAQALNAIVNSQSPPVGTPPAVAPIPGPASPQPAAAAVPPANPDAQAPSYDVAHDPGWKGLIDPSNHALRNFFNGISPEERELLRAWRFGAAAPPVSTPPLVAPPSGASTPPTL